MRLIEADGKRLLSDIGIAIPEAIFLSFDQLCPSSLPLAFPVFVKAQVLAGRRGASGLVRRCESVVDVRQTLEELRKAIWQRPCAGFLIERDVPHAAEWFLSVTLDRESGTPRVSVSPDGGMSVQRVSSTMDEVPSAIRDAAVKLSALWREQDAINVEVNPLALCVDGSVVALDAKIELDDAAAFRHPEWQTFSSLPTIGRAPSERERAYTALLAEAGHRGTLGRYVELDGDIALILSGGGASLVALDALERAGGCAANYVEMSGNPDPEEVRRAATIVFSKPGLRAVWIAGSFANFTDIHATVAATLDAVRLCGLRVPIVIRRDGPQASEAQEAAERFAVERGVIVQFHRADTDLDVSARAVVWAARRAITVSL